MVVLMIRALLHVIANAVGLLVNGVKLATKKQHIALGSSKK